MRSSASAEAADPAVVGAKAATLALARRVGLPVLPGWVLPVASGRAAATAAATALAERGTGAARPAALRTPLTGREEEALRTAVVELGGRVIVRSSSPLEADLRWSGAFASVGEVGPDDIGVAVRSCRASAFAPDPLERAEACGVAPEDLALAVLLQPELIPERGGVARIVDGTVHITAVDGHPGALLSGWTTGKTITDGAVTALADQTAGLLGHDTIEWAVADGTLYLLQSAKSAEKPINRGNTAGGRWVSGVGADGQWADAAADGQWVGGTVAVAGDAVGILRYVHPHQPVSTAEPTILVVDRPVPALAPLLFGARGLVSVSGPAACHLVEVARAIGVPVLTGADVASVTGPLAQLNAGRRLAAIDGARAALVVQPGPAAAATDLAAAVTTVTSALE